MAGDQTSETAVTTLPLLFSNLIPNAAVYLTAGTNLMLDVYAWLREHGIHYGVAMVWDKGPPAVVSWNRYHPEHENIIFCGKGSLPGGANDRWFGDHNETTVWRIPIDDRGTKIHRAQKPVALYERAIVNSSSLGEIVVDPFAGSGTCLIAAEKHNRSAYCMELDPRYVDVAVKRWEHFTGNKAQRTATSETLAGELKG
jgi:DNA modification methylase